MPDRCSEMNPITGTAVSDEAMCTGPKSGVPRIVSNDDMEIHPVSSPTLTTRPEPHLILNDTAGPLRSSSPSESFADDMR